MLSGSQWGMPTRAASRNYNFSVFAGANVGRSRSLKSTWGAKPGPLDHDPAQLMFCMCRRVGSDLNIAWLPPDSGDSGTIPHSTNIILHCPGFRGMLCISHISQIL